MNDTFFREKVLAKKGMLFRAALRILNDRHDAEDATSEVILKAWTRKDKLIHYENLDGVLYTIIRNLCIDMLRARKNFQSFEYEMESAENTDESDDSSKLEQVKKIIENLPQKQRMMIHFRMTEGYSMQKIADIMDEKVNTVEVNISRARKTIRREYEKNNLN